MTEEIDKLAWIHIKEKQLLSTRSKGKEAYYLPGGKREPGESDAAALIRELKEELTIDVVPTSIRYVETFKAQADGKPTGVMVKMTCYEADFTGEIAAASEIAELIWIDYRDYEKCSPVLKLILDWLLARELIVATGG
ncbi:MAG: NUDIX domain-containing protein [Caldilineaceae bacterium]|nr:NUDIX domain-containing protein [Caldilineaceae bacterium]